MLRPTVDTLSRFLLAACGSMAWLAFAVGTTARGQGTSASTVSISTVNVPQVNVPKIVVPPINVPKVNVQVQTSRQGSGSATAATAGRWAVSAPSSPENGDEDPENPEPDALPQIASRPTGFPSVNAQRYRDSTTCLGD